MILSVVIGQTRSAFSVAAGDFDDERRIQSSARPPNEAAQASSRGFSVVVVVEFESLVDWMWNSAGVPVSGRR